MDKLTPGRKLRYGVETVGFFLLMTIFVCLPLDIASWLGGWMGRHIFSRLPPDKIARANLKAAFPEKSHAEIETILRRMWDNLGRTVAEYPHLEKFTLSGPNPRIRAHDTGLLPAAMAPGNGLMILSAHLANWEMLPIAGEQIGLNGAPVVRPPNNPYVASWIARQRGLSGPKDQIGKHSGARRIFSQLRAGKVIYMLVDQRNDEGIAVDFFGRPAMTTPVPAALVLRTGCKILIAGNRRNGARFDVTVYPGPDFSPTGDDEADTRQLTQMITARIEELIRAEPSSWLWIHRRWEIRQA